MTGGGDCLLNAPLLGSPPVLVDFRKPLVSRKSRLKNPFYPLLVVVGLAFAITACGFAVMMVRDMSPSAEMESDGGGAMIQFFQDHGFTALMIELGVLALATFAAIATEEFWTDQADVPAMTPPTPSPKPLGPKPLGPKPLGPKPLGDNDATTTETEQATRNRPLNATSQSDGPRRHS